MTAVIALLLCVCVAQLSLAQPSDASQSAPKKSRVVGVIKSINGSTVTLTTDSGSDINVTLQPATRLLRMAPGQTDLKSATPIQLTDIQVGDRMLAGGTPSDDDKSLTASSVVIMKKSDVAEKQEHDREEWQRNGIGGVVKAVDLAASTITVSTGALGASSLSVQVTKDTIIRRYAPDSVKFDAAKPGTLAQIKIGDQLRARGTKSEDGKEMTAAEIVSGTFRSIPGAVVSADAANNTITVTDLTDKRPVTLKIGPDSQMHQLPAMFAQGIAMRLKGVTPPGAGGPGGSGAMSGRPPGGDAKPTGAMGQGGPRPGGGPDFQRMLNRLPTVEISQLQKGDAVMIVATEGTAESPSQVIILLSGVEAILAAASPATASTILSPWNLSAGANMGTGDSQ
ncbi:MAG TPA: hypothetical protein VKB58_10995 [Terriglobales bacterium]|nr:hypothetical protein [Terriglobales bacterium]